MTVSHRVPTVSGTQSDDCVPPPPPLRGADTVGRTQEEINNATVSGTQSSRPADLAQELLRLSLLARLALQLDNRPLARRAARYAAPLVRLLAGLDDGRADDGDELPQVEELLEQLRPVPTDSDDSEESAA